MSSKQPSTPPRTLSYAQAAQQRKQGPIAPTNPSVQPRPAAQATPQPVQTPHNAVKHDERLQHAKDRVVAAMLAMGTARHDVKQARTRYERTLSEDASDSSTSATGSTTTTTATITASSAAGSSARTQQRLAQQLAAQELAKCERELERTKNEYLVAKYERDTFDDTASPPLAPSPPLSSRPATPPQPTAASPPTTMATTTTSPSASVAATLVPASFASQKPAQAVPNAPTSSVQPSFVTARAPTASAAPSLPSPAPFYTAGSAARPAAAAAPSTSPPLFAPAQSTTSKTAGAAAHSPTPSSVPAWHLPQAAPRTAPSTPTTTTLKLDHNEWRSVLSLLTRYNKKPLEAFLQQCNVLDLDELDPSTTAPAGGVPVLTFAKWLAQRVRCNFATISNAMRDSLPLSSAKASGDIEKLHRLAVRAERELRTQSSRRTHWEYVRAVTARIYAATNDNNADPLLAFRRQCVATEATAPDLLDTLWHPVLQGALEKTMEAHGFDECSLFFGNASATAEQIVALAVTSLNEILTQVPSEEWEHAHVFTCTTAGAAPVVHILVPFGYKAVLRVRLFALDFSSTNGVVNSIYNMLAMYQIINYKLEQGHFAPLRVTSETCGHATCHSAAHNLSLVDMNMLHTLDVDTGLMHVLTKRDGWRATRPQRTPEPSLSPYQQLRTAKHSSHSNNHFVPHAHADKKSDLAQPKATTTKTTKKTKTWADWNADSDDDDDDVKFFQ